MTVKSSRSPPGHLAVALSAGPDDWPRYYGVRAGHSGAGRAVICGSDRGQLGRPGAASWSPVSIHLIAAGRHRPPSPPSITRRPRDLSPVFNKTRPLRRSQRQRYTTGPSGAGVGRTAALASGLYAPHGYTDRRQLPSAGSFVPGRPSGRHSRRSNFLAALNVRQNECGCCAFFARDQIKFSRKHYSQTN